LPILAQKLSRIGDWGGSNLDANSLQSGSVLDAIQQGAVVAEFVAGTGGTGAGLAYQILQAGFQLNIPRMFAALLLISLTGVFLFLFMSWLSRKALGGWHSSEVTGE